MNALRPSPRCHALLLVSLALIPSCTDSTAVDSMVHPSAPLLNIEGLDVGDNHACVLVSDGSVWCWGYNDQGQLGSAGYAISPRAVLGLEDATRLVLGGELSCAQTAARTLFCWGQNSGLQQGTRATGGNTAVEVENGADADDLTLGYSTMCKVSDGTLFCWGGLDYGQGKSMPTAIGASSLAHGFPVCAGMVDGSIWCWGENHSGLLGDGTTDDRWTPGPIVDPGEKLSFAAASHWSVFAIGESGALYAWGDNGPFGQLGTGDEDMHPAPALVHGLPSMRSVDAGPFHSCGVSIEGQAYCWGNGQGGQLGTASTESSLVPLPVAFDRPVRHIAVGDYWTCLLTEAREVYCFGDSLLGDGTFAPSAVPVRVHFPWEEQADAGG